MATFHIETDRQSYFPGDTVEGKVLINVPASIKNTEGVKLKFSGLQNVKWVQKTQTIPEKFTNPQEQSTPATKTDNKAQQQAYHVHEPSQLSISSCEFEEKKQDLRPSFIKTPQNKYYQIKYHHKSNQISKGYLELIPSGKLQAGQYSFPFSFTTHSQWPASFKEQTSQRKLNVKYSLTVTLEPYNPRFQFTANKEIVLRDRISSKNITEFHSQVSSLYCLKRGRTEVKASFDRQGYSPEENGQIILQIDNSRCQTDIQSLKLTLRHTEILRGLEQTSKTRQVFTKQINCCIKAAQSATGSEVLKVPFTLPEGLSTTRGQLISSDYTLQIKLKHDALFHQNAIHKIPFTVYPPKSKNEVPWDMRSKWQPKVMGLSKLTVSNLESTAKQANILK